MSRKRQREKLLGEMKKTGHSRWGRFVHEMKVTKSRSGGNWGTEKWEGREKRDAQKQG